MTEASGLTPTARGVLAKTPLVHLLVYMADHGYSGSLVLSEPDRGPGEDHTVYFFEGMAAKFRTGRPVAPLGRVLVELGQISEQVLGDSLAKLAGRRELHGEYLVRAGAINRAKLMDALRAQSHRKMAFIFGLAANTAFSFYEDTNLLGSWGGPELTLLEPLPTIWSGIRAAGDDPVVDLMLGRLGATTLKLHDKSHVRRFGFSPEESTVVDLIRARPGPLASLIETAPVSKRTVELIVYALLVTRHLDHGAGSALPVGVRGITDTTRLRAASVPVARMKLRAAEGSDSHGAGSIGPSSPPTSERGRVLSGPPVFGSSASSVRPGPPAPGAATHTPGSRAPSRTAPLATSPSGSPGAQGRSRVSSRPPWGPLNSEQAARRDAIVKRAAGIDRENYYQMLGLASDASNAQIQAAYYALAKIWHPDRLPDELSRLRDSVSKVFARVNEAFDTLSDPAKRQRYTEVLKGGGGTPEEAQKIQQILDAANDFQRAEILWRKKDANAEEYIMRAYHADPDQPDYIALYVMLQLSKRSPDAMVDDLIKLCDHAIEVNERSERAYFCRGMLRKRIGRIESAMSDFRAAYEVNPKNLDAAREVRLHEMRRGKSERSLSPAQRRTSAAPNKSTPSGRPSMPPRKSPLPTKKDGGVLSGIGKLFKR